MNNVLENLIIFTCESLESGHISNEDMEKLASSVGQVKEPLSDSASLLRYRAIAAIIRQSLEISKARTASTDLEKTWGRQGSKPEETELEKTWGRQGSKPEEAELEKTWGRQSSEPEGG